REGLIARGVPACMACHGPSGAGNPGPAYPHIGGQHASYVARRLQEYQAGQTHETDKAHFQIMATVAQKLSEQEVQALSSYLQGLHNKADDVAVTTTPAQPAAAP
ncbi:MAG: cytochrome C, partial [Stenotrophomonas maltophilia]